MKDALPKLDVLSVIEDKAAALTAAHELWTDMHTSDEPYPDHQMARMDLIYMSLLDENAVWTETRAALVPLIGRDCDHQGKLIQTFMTARGREYTCQQCLAVGIMVRPTFD